MTSLFDAAISPLLDLAELPHFDSLTANHVEPAIDHALAVCRKSIEELLNSESAKSFNTLVEPMETLTYQLERVWSPVTHLNNVMNNDELRVAHNNCLEKLSAFWSELNQNDQLFKAYKEIRENEDELSDDQKRLLDLALIDFELGGVSLPADKREKFTELKLDLAQLQSKFEENVLDCSNAWHYHTTNEKELDGVPTTVINLALKEAADNDQEGWRFNLDFPTYYAVLSHATDSSLRKKFYDAWVTRASKVGGHDAQYDNTNVIEKIMDKRQQLADLLDYENYAEYSLAKKMATSGPQVKTFIRDLSSRSREAAQQELDNLTKFAKTDIAPWDLSFWAERYREATFDISDEMLRPYFPLEKALAGLFEITQEIFNVVIKQIDTARVWHPDVRMYQIDTPQGERVGRFYVDLFARSKKRGGAWMDVCIGHNRMGNRASEAVAYLVCNFLPAEDDKPALLTHNEIVTLFHEFGHTLHHLLSQVSYPGIAGISGVPWDAVELPSQFMENFAWNEDTLPKICGHYQTNQAMPDDMFERLLGTRTFHAGLQSLRQLEFALFDMRLHSENNSSYEQVLEEVRDEISIVPVTDNNRFANAFSHIFAGGYAAGYYSYKWAEVLSADAFGAFEENGILDATTGQRFKQCILERGGAVDAMDAFKAFRGRKPSIDALVRHNGLEQAS